MRALTNSEIDAVAGGRGVLEPPPPLPPKIPEPSLPYWLKEKPKVFNPLGTYKEYIDPAGSPEAEAIRRG